MPAGFGFPFNQEIWIPRRQNEAIPGGLVFGRLRSDVSARQASEQFTALARGLATDANDFVWDADAKPQARAVGSVRIIAVVPFAERGVKNALRMMLSAGAAAGLRQRCQSRVGARG